MRIYIYTHTHTCIPPKNIISFSKSIKKIERGYNIISIRQKVIQKHCARSCFHSPKFKHFFKMYLKVRWIHLKWIPFIKMSLWNTWNLNFSFTLCKWNSHANLLHIHHKSKIRISWGKIARQKGNIRHLSRKCSCTGPGASRRFLLNSTP